MSSNEETIENGKDEVKCKKEIEKKEGIGWGGRVKGIQDKKNNSFFEREIGGECGAINFQGPNTL